jgi:chaperonin GroEL
MLREQIDSETMDATAEKLHDRLSKLEGKICIFKIGAPTETEKEELEFRIEDAINSTRNAYIEGIVPGGGATLLELSKLDVSPIYYTALRNTFKRLLENAGFETEVKLREALDCEKPGYGYNLRKSDELVDVMKEGVIDPVTVVREVIKNSTSAIGGAVTIGSTIIYEDKE